MASQANLPAGCQQEVAERKVVCDSSMAGDGGRPKSTENVSRGQRESLLLSLVRHS